MFSMLEDSDLQWPYGWSLNKQAHLDDFSSFLHWLEALEQWLSTWMKSRFSLDSCSCVPPSTSSWYFFLIWMQLWLKCPLLDVPGCQIRRLESINTNTKKPALLGFLLSLLLGWWDTPVMGVYFQSHISRDRGLPVQAITNCSVQLCGWRSQDPAAGWHWARWALPGADCQMLTAWRGCPRPALTGPGGGPAENPTLTRCPEWSWPSLQLPPPLHSSHQSWWDSSTKVRKKSVMYAIWYENDDSLKLPLSSWIQEPGISGVICSNRDFDNHIIPHLMRPRAWTWPRPWIWPCTRSWHWTLDLALAQTPGVILTPNYIIFMTEHACETISWFYFLFGAICYMNRLFMQNQTFSFWISFLGSDISACSHIHHISNYNLIWWTQKQFLSQTVNCF